MLLNMLLVDGSEWWNSCVCICVKWDVVFEGMELHV